jgi:hypothetical protein
MAISDDRPSTRLGDVEFEFEHPLLDKNSSGRKAEHEVLPTDESGDDGKTVVQPLGSGKTTLTLTGTAYREEVANDLDGLEGEIVELRHSRHSGDVFVDGVSTTPQEAVDEEGRWYSYTADLIAVS